MDYLRACLDSLEYPKWDSMDIGNGNDCVHLVSWLEDRKIRELDIPDRAGLRTGNDGWDSAVVSYLATLNCPYSWTKESELDCLTWLVSHAIALEYEDIADLYEDKPADDSHLDNGEEIVQPSDMGIKIDELGRILDLNRQHNESDPDYLQRISRSIRLFFTPGSQQLLESGSDASQVLASFPLGFDTADLVVNKIALILKMLYLSEYRELQTDLNALIVLGQEYTANPRTNAVLGKVGR